ncbi:MULTISPECIES: ABC transporter ATP-binding protein [Streptomyces]|uniref:ABC transporter ATP-binding protein n=1 Tax=Streptomyces wadayamensis TaxID=141454 RepID=A0ABR4S3K5_9ACTN|nr:MULTISPECIES: ABC transporter ATP-binding protein [Streptomyces]KDR60204.1 ABC transporter ATP-binding protein [Streptomyces wadayamensis]QXQ25542.1 ABC transporter ATP-binding protein [Streptomyces albidoflavus]QXQ31469.1 ABC transporter ATP-binding protein [Streptomyces albidoflavus]RZE57865.1 ABC transporter ATP-binding protein [Streptomyces albidoflavus]RZE62997.1 ABC transporter ATP-binding protein [Streptomyces albidoflavus]
MTDTDTDTAIEARGLGKRFGRRNALDACSFRLPAGRICALVGPNGAGKSTLLTLAAGLARPSGGELRVLGTTPAEARREIAYVAQDKALFPQLTVADTLRLGADLNPGRWDQEAAERIVHGDGAESALDPYAKVRGLSGGQRTRVALALALGKRPALLLLDEPVSDLDPLARHQLMGTLLAEAAEHGTTVVMSSHILGELAGACDFLLLLGSGRVRMAGPADDLTAVHRLVTGPGGAAELAPHTVIESRPHGRGQSALIRPEGPVGPGWECEEPSLEDVLLAHLRNPSAPALLAPEATVRDLAGTGVQA